MSPTASPSRRRPARRIAAAVLGLAGVAAAVQFSSASAAPTQWSATASKATPARGKSLVAEARRHHNAVDPTVAPASGERYSFGYANRAALIADGWDFLAKTAAGRSRDTERAAPARLGYSASGLKVTAGPGDLWKRLNNTRNTLFRDLPADWSTVQLAVDFAPVANDQQAGLAIYGDDDNYVQLIRTHVNRQAAEFISETNAAVSTDRFLKTTSTALLLRLARSGDKITGSLSTNGGATWTEAGSVQRQFAKPRLAITVGGSGHARRTPAATLREVLVGRGGGVGTSPTQTAPTSPPPTSAPATPSPSPVTSATPSSSSSPTPTVSVPSASASSSTPAAKGFPTRDTTGVPSGWAPTKSVTGDYTISQDGAVVQDLRVTNGTLYVRASNVTLRRVEVVGGRIVNDYGRSCYNGLVIEDSSILRGDNDPENPVIEAGGYTLRRVKIDGPSEGIRVGEKGLGCGPVDVEDSWVQVDPPDNCVADNVDWHGDGLQGYQGSALTIRNSYLRLAEVKGCSGTAAFFYPDQGNTSVTVDHVLVSGGGYVFRLGTPGSVTGLKVVDDSWDFGPVDVANCGVVSWGAGNEIVEVNTDGSLTSVGSLGCVTR